MPANARLCYNPHLLNSKTGEPLVRLRFISLISCAFVVLASANLAFAQEAAKTEEKKAAPAGKEAGKALTAEQIAESTLLIYGFPGGRETLKQIRKTAIERGTINIANAEGKMEQATYQRWSIRGENLEKEKIRLDQDFPKARYALVYNDEKIYGIYNDAMFTPREDASKAFQNQIIRGLEALLRYKENGSTLTLAGQDKIMGVDFHLIDVTDKQGRKTRFFVSAKRFRVMMLEYEEAGTKYRRKFYNYNYAQGTLVPYRTVLWAGDKIVEETDVSTVTFGQKVDEQLFTERAG
jgi:hypothetical protein